MLSSTALLVVCGIAVTANAARVRVAPKMSESETESSGVSSSETQSSGVSSSDVQRLGRSHASSTFTAEPSCEICTQGAVFQPKSIADEESGSTCQYQQDWLNTPEGQATMTCPEAQAFFGPKCCKVKGAEQKLLAALGPQLQKDLLHVLGKERVVQILELQEVEFTKDQVTTGLMDLQEDALKRQKTMLAQVVGRAADMPGKPCSQLPDSVLSHLWRYKEEDVLKCLGGEQEGAQSLIQTTNCNDEEDEIPGSSKWSWQLTPCTSKGGHTCTHADGGEGCCCPAGKRWHAGKSTCVDCGASSAISAGDTCELRCALLPDKVAQLTCGSSVAFEAIVPEGQCRWRRDEEVVQTLAGPVQGFVRPVLWNWDWSQYEAGALASIELAYVRTFWDIPFGNPIEMWKRPVKVDSWAPEVKQSPDFYQDKFQVKDCDTDDHDACLTLSVYVPPDTTVTSAKPVMFWLPGSGFRSADAWAAGIYDGARFAMRQDALFVISNARSSLLGHWASYTLADEDKDLSTGNYGFMDQRLALEWIQANIANFGGDPARVTIAGHSSGGFAVGFHLFSPDSRGLFSAAIPEGATLDSPWYMQELSESNDFYAELGEAMGCPKDPPIDQISCLRKLKRSEFKTFIEGQTGIMGEDMTAKVGKVAALSMSFEFMWSKLGGFAGAEPGPYVPKPGYVNFKAAPMWPLLPIGPCVDGSRAGLRKQPRELMEDNSNVAQVPVYLSYAKDEGTIFSVIMTGSYPWAAVPTPTHAGVDAMVKWFTAGDQEFANQVIEHYPRSMGSPHTRLSEMIGDAVFKCSNHRFAMLTSAQKKAKPVYLAETDYIQGQARRSWLPSMEGMLGRIFGASHMTASSYVMAKPMMGTFDDASHSLSMLVNCHYAFFLHCGDPHITKSSKCYRDHIDMDMIHEGRKPKANLRACLDKTLHLNTFNWTRPLTRFNHKLAHKYMINVKPGTVRIPDKERQLCKFWDNLPVSKFKFVPNICRKCGDKAGRRMDPLLGNRMVGYQEMRADVIDRGFSEDFVPGHWESIKTWQELQVEEEKDPSDWGSPINDTVGEGTEDDATWVSPRETEDD